MSATPPAGFPHWRQNLFAATAASFIGFAGFTLVMPFLPFYIGQLGVTGVGEIATWTGLSLGITPALTAMLSPFWGRVADRSGSKLMVERAILSCVIVMAAMAFVTRAWHIFALRLIQGFFAGYGGLTVAMVAETAPRDRLAAAIGKVHMAQRLGPALGPVIGGAVAQVVGLRRAFLVTAGFYLMAFLVVLLLYHEPPRGAVPRSRSETGRVTFRNVLAFQNFMLLMAAIFGIQFAERSLGPILPLYVARSGVGTARVPLLSGLLFSVAAGTGALGNTLCGRFLRQRTAREVIAASALLGMLGMILAGSSSSPAGLTTAMALAGFGIGLALTAAYTAGGYVIPSGAHGTAFGMLSGASLAALAVSPVIAGLLSAYNLRLVFLINVLALGGLAVAVWKTMVDTFGGPESRVEARGPSVEVVEGV